MARLVIVSNRLVSPGEKLARAGGLAVGLRDALARRGGLWFGWSGETTEGAAGAPRLSSVGKITYATLDINAADYRDFYVGYANGALWPLFHHRPGLSLYRRSAFEGYLRVNTWFAQNLKPLPMMSLMLFSLQCIPGATACVLHASRTLVSAASNFGWLLCWKIPRFNDKSSGPTKTASTPGTERISSKLSNAI